MEFVLLALHIIFRLKMTASNAIQIAKSALNKVLDAQSAMKELLSKVMFACALI